MSVSANWIDDDPDTKIVYIKFSGAWTWDEFSRLIDEKVIPMLATLPEGEGSMINDIRESEHLPINAVDQAAKVMRRVTGWEMTVVIGASQFVRMFVGVIKRLFPALSARVAMAPTVADARRVIGEHRRRKEK